VGHLLSGLFALRVTGPLDQAALAGSRALHITPARFLAHLESQYREAGLLGPEEHFSSEGTITVALTFEDLGAALRAKLELRALCPQLTFYGPTIIGDISERDDGHSPAPL
jgi:hypothetical protein